MSIPSKDSSKDAGAAKAWLVVMEESWAQLWAQQEKEEREMEKMGVSNNLPCKQCGRLLARHAFRRPEGPPAGSATSRRWGAAWWRRTRREGGLRS